MNQFVAVRHLEQENKKLKEKLDCAMSALRAVNFALDSDLFPLHNNYSRNVSRTVREAILKVHVDR